MQDDLPRIEAIFAEALNQPDAAARAAYLDQACGDDAALRERVEALLGAHEATGNVFRLPDGAPPAQAVAPSVSEGPGSKIGRYKLLEQIGEGGFGVVFMAEQTEPVQRKVALKIIKPGMDTRAVIARFEAERQALALMDHPHIAKVLDAGSTETGRPYFVMELVKGLPIVQYCDDHRFTPRQRLELFVTVCQAVQHAHQKGIIHRDLKPTNVLVADYDERPAAMVIDFGVAKAIGRALTEKTLFTEFGQVIGTIDYMSPEQAKLNQLDIDTRTDIYSLGVLLYELVAGSTPLDRKRLQSAAFDEMLRIIREEEPPAPSTRLSDSDALPSIAANRGLEPKKLTGLVRGELDWIVMKSLEKDRNRRYETANGLAHDIENYLNDEPVVACPPSAGYRLRKFVRKNRGLLISIVAFAVLLIVGTTVSAWQAIRATRALKETREANEQTKEALAASTEERRLSEAVSNYLVQAFRSPDPEQDGRALKVVDVLAQAEAELDSDFAGSPRAKGKLLEALGKTYLGLGLPEKAVPVFEKARAVLQTALGRDHIDTILCANDLAVAYRVAGRLDDAVPLSEKMLELTAAKLGAEDLNTILCLSNLADVYRDAGRLTEAIPLSEETLRLRRSQLGPNDHETLLSLSNLAQTYHAAGQWGEALPLFEEALKLRKAQSGPSHPATLMCMNNLAVAYRISGRMDDAIALSEEALATAKVKLGSDHVSTIMCLGNLAAAYAEAGQLGKAVPLMEQTLKVRRGKLGLDHPSTLLSMNNLAMTYRATGRPKEALPLFEETRKLMRAKLGVDHPNTIMSMNNLALAYGDVGRLAESLALFEETLKLMREKLGPDHPDTLLSMSNLADVYREAGKLAEATSLSEEALRRRRDKLGGHHPDTLVSMRNLAGAYIAQQQYAQASQLFQEVVALEKKKPGIQQVELVQLLARIGQVWLEQRQYAEAEPYLREALEIREKNQPDDWTTFNSKSMLGASLLGQKKFVAAEPLLLAGFEGMKARADKMPAAARDRLREAAERLVELFNASNKPDEAAKWRTTLDGLRAGQTKPEP